MAGAVEAAIGLGANLGDRRGQLRRAVAGLGGLGEVVAVSSLYESAPIGGPEQGPYLNAVAIVSTALPPRALLDGLLGLEAAAGRERRERWGPRPLDLDVLLYGAQIVDEPGLRVPHPRMTVRRFVLAPLFEVRPGARLPGGGPLAAYLAATDPQDLAKVAEPDWPDEG